MRKLNSHKLSSLKKLTNLRKAMLTSELGIIQARVAEKDAQIKELKKPFLDLATVSEIRSTHRYQMWRQQEIPRLTVLQAALRAELSLVQRNLGRAYAEDATADHLQKNLQTEKYTKKNRQAELASSLHFLPDNVSDEDV